MKTTVKEELSKSFEEKFDDREQADLRATVTPAPCLSEKPYDSPLTRRDGLDDRLRSVYDAVAVLVFPS